MRDEDSSQRACADREPDLGVGATAAEPGGGHAQDLAGFAVEAATGAVARAIDRLRHRGRLREFVADAPCAMRHGIRPGGEAGHALENPVQVPPRKPCLAGHLVERRGRRRALDETAQCDDDRLLSLRERGLVGLAAPAGPKPGTLGVFRRAVESDVLGAGPACGARGSAIHAGGPDRVEERSVGACIARNDAAPTRVVDHCIVQGDSSNGLP